MREHNRIAAVSRFRAALTGLLMLAAATASAQYMNNNSGYGSNSGYGNSGYGSNSGYGNSGYGSNSGSRYGSSGGSSRYSSSRYSSSSSADALNSEYGSGYGSGSGRSRSGQSYLNRSGSKYQQERNQRSTKDSKSSENVASKTTAGQADRARAGQQKVTIARTKPTGKAAPKKASAGGTTQAAIPPDFKANALYFTPGLKTIESGDQFDSSITYFNRAKQPIETINLWVHYDPKLVEPIWVKADALDALTTSPITSRVWRDEGYIHISANIGHTLGEAINPLVEINWRSKAPAVQTSIDLAAPANEQPTGIYAAGQNILLNNFFTDPSDISLQLQIQAKVNDNYDEMNVDNLRKNLTQVDVDPLKRVRIAIVMPPGKPSAGQVATADVMLLNPANLDLDKIKMRIRYQPDAVQVLDADQDNYLTKGINIFDGDFHERYPFDDIVANQVNPSAGLIEYEAGSLAGPRAYPGGTFARIVYRPLKPNARVVFWFEVENPATGERATDIQREGVSLLGGTDDVAMAALHGAETQAQ